MPNPLAIIPYAKRDPNKPGLLRTIGTMTDVYHVSGS